MGKVRGVIKCLFCFADLRFQMGEMQTVTCSCSKIYLIEPAEEENRVLISLMGPPEAFLSGA